MNLEAIYFISQVVAAVALVGSLIFVGIQIRQVAKNRRNEARLNREAKIVEGMESLSQLESGELWRRCGAADPDVSDSEWSRYYFGVGSLLVSTRARFHEHRQGMLNDEEWAAHKGNIDYLLAGPGFRAAFEANRDAAYPDPEFYGEFEGALAQPPNLNHAEIVSAMKDRATNYRRKCDTQARQEPGTEPETAALQEEHSE